MYVVNVTVCRGLRGHSVRVLGRSCVGGATTAGYGYGQRARAGAGAVRECHGPGEGARGHSRRRLVRARRQRRASPLEGDPGTVRSCDYVR